jgi:hypothetical protein
MSAGWEPSGAAENYGSYHEPASGVSFGISTRADECYLIPIAPGGETEPLPSGGGPLMGI